MTVSLEKNIAINIIANNSNLLETNTWAEDREAIKSVSQHIVKNRDREIYVLDNQDIKIHEQITELEGIFHSIIKVPFPKSYTVSPFIRDSGVTLFDGMRLIPYTIHEIGKILPILQKIAFDYVDSFYAIEGDLAMVCGKGFNQEETDFAMIMGLKYDTSFKRARTCIEGGNCFLFMSNNQRYALVGNFSFYLSWIALQEQGYFEGSLEECLENAEIAYQVQKPITPEDLEKANSFESQLLFTKKIMAEELGVSLDNLIILPQTMFHIDTELFVTPDEKIALHDDQLAKELIENLLTENENTLSNEEKILYNEFLENAEHRIEEGDSILGERDEILKNSGLTIQLLPALFESKKSKISLNYCNGIFIEKSQSISNNNNSKRKMLQNSFYYITTGPSTPEEKRIHQCFIKHFDQTFPNFSFKGIEGLSKTMGAFEGGIRCLTSDTALI